MIRLSTMIPSHTIHIRFAGRSFDAPLSVLDLGPGASNEAIKWGLARYLEVEPGQLDDYVIDRHANGNVTVRPEAVFG